MDTATRLKAAFLGEPTDRPPVYGWIGVPLLKELTGIPDTRQLLQSVIDDPGVVIQVQRDLGLDPIVVTVDDRWFSMHIYWRLLYDHAEEGLATWQVTTESVPNGDFTTYHFTAATPEGPITWGYDVGNDQVGELERPLQTSRDLELLSRYMPAPEALQQDRLAEIVRRVGNDAFITHNFIGVWGEAANMRGLVDLCTDIFDRPELVHALSEFLTERSVRRVRHLAQTGVHSIVYDQSWVGVGLSPEHYREFIKPYDMQVVAAAKESGLLVSYHNCGRGMSLLEDMVDCGGHALETLTPKTSSGDFDLAEVKRRVGDRITLNGGYDERILATATPAEAREQALRCLDAAAEDGRYILRTTGQMFEANPGTIEAFAEAAREFQYSAAPVGAQGDGG